MKSKFGSKLPALALDSLSSSSESRLAPTDCNHVWGPLYISGKSPSSLWPPNLAQSLTLLRLFNRLEQVISTERRLHSYYRLLCQLFQSLLRCLYLLQSGSQRQSQRNSIPRNYKLHLVCRTSTLSQCQNPSPLQRRQV